MKKILLIIILGFLSISNAYALKFEKCFTKWVADKDIEKMLIEDDIFGKFNDQKFENSYYRVFNDGTAERVIIKTDKWNKEESKKIDEEFKDSDWATPKVLAKMKKKIRRFDYKVVFANENYITLEDTGKKLSAGDPRITATLNLKTAEISSTGYEGDVRIIKQCIISGKAKSSLLDYWWALILIIAITFFVYTQSATRLKKLKIRK